MKRFISMLSSLCLATTTLVSAVTASPIMTASAADKPTAAADAVQFDLLPMPGENPVDYEVTYEGGYNVIHANPGEEIVMALYVTQDPGSIGQRVIMDFSEVTYIETDAGSSAAYTGISMEVGDKYVSSPDPKTGCQYLAVVWVATANKVADPNQPLCVFVIETPEKDGVYTIGETTYDEEIIENGVSMGIKTNVTETLVETDVKDVFEQRDYVFYGLQIVVGDDVTTTTTTTTTTASGDKTTTTTTTTTGSTPSVEPEVKPNTPADAVQFDLLPMPGENPVDYDVTYAGGYNVIHANGGDEIVMALYVTQDPGSIGQRVIMDFSEVIYLETDAGSSAAYTGISMEVGDKYVSTPDPKTGCQYLAVVWVATANKVADPDQPLCVFVIEVPAEDGVYTIGETTYDEEIIENGVSMGIKTNVTETLVETDVKDVFEQRDYVFYGLRIVVGEDVTTSTTTTTTTDEGTTTTTTSDSDSTTTTTTTTVIETTTTTTSEPIPAGDAQWMIATVEAEAGETVTVPVSVKNDAGSSGFIVEFAYDSALTFQGIEWVGGYTGEAVINQNVVRVVWSDDSGADQTLTAETVIMNLIFTAPNAAGEYPVTFSELEVVNTDGNALNVTTTDGMVIVAAQTTTTTSAPIKAGDAAWEIATTVAAAGETVTVPVSVTKDEGTAGFVVDFTYDPALTFQGIEWVGGYTGEVVINQDQLVVVWSDDSGYDQTLTGETVILNLIFTAPNAAGEYPVEFGTLEVVNTDGNELTVDKTNGMVIVEETTTTTEATTTESTSTEATTTESTTTEATTTESTSTEATTTESTSTEATTTESTSTEATTTTSTTLEPGEVGWYIATTVAAAGETGVRVPVTVKNDPGTAGFVVSFTYDPALTFEGIEWAAGYSGEAVINLDQLYVVWADDNGDNQIAAEDAVVLYLVFTAPDAAGEYPVNFGELEVINTDGNNIMLFQENGMVIVEETTTTTESTTTESGTTESSTTTESTTTESGTTESSTTTESTTTESGTTESSTTTESTTTESGTLGPDPGYVVYQIGNVQGNPGEIVSVPVTVLYDDGAAGFSMEFNVPDGFVITGVTYGPAYTSADGEYIWNAEEYVLVWTDNNGEIQIAENGAVIVNLLIQVPDDAEADTTYPVTFGDVTAQDNNGADLTFVLVDGSIYIKPQSTTGTSPIPDPGNAVYNVEDASGRPGEQVQIPIDVWFDNGTASFSFQIDLPDGLTIDDITFDPDYLAHGDFSWDPETNTLTWTSKDGTNYVPTPGQNIATITVTIPEDAEPGTVYPIDLANVSAIDENGNPLNTTVNAGELTVIKDGSTTAPPVAGTTTYVTSYETSFEAPTRVNYWSHDYRTFGESGGLVGLNATLTVYKYYIDEDGHFVDEDGSVISGAPIYDGETLPVNAAFASKTANVTAMTKPEEMENSPLKIWTNEIIDQFGENYTPQDELKAEHANKYPVDCYYYPTEQDDPDFMFDGEPIYFGTFKIYIGVKGDWNLDNKVMANDAMNALIYYAEGVVGRTYSLNDDPELDGPDGLIFYLLNVQYRQTNQPDSPFENEVYGAFRITPVDAKDILCYYADNVSQLGRDWTYQVGYDLLDNFYGDDYQ